MDFSVEERLVLLQLLGKIEGNLLLVRQVRALQDIVGFSEADLTALEFKQEGTQVVWRKGAVAPLSVTVSPSLHTAIGKLLQQLDAAGQLGMGHLSLCDKFLPAPE
jgi:hypothetical protein